jgi:hypothetical protein
MTTSSAWRSIYHYYARGIRGDETSLSSASRETYAGTAPPAHKITNRSSMPWPPPTARRSSSRQLRHAANVPGSRRHLTGCNPATPWCTRSLRVLPVISVGRRGWPEMTALRTRSPRSISRPRPRSCKASGTLAKCLARFATTRRRRDRHDDRVQPGARARGQGFDCGRDSNLAQSPERRGVDRDPTCLRWSSRNSDTGTAKPPLGSPGRSGRRGGRVAAYTGSARCRNRHG